MKTPIWRRNGTLISQRVGEEGLSRLRLNPRPAIPHPRESSSFLIRQCKSRRITALGLVLLLIVSLFVATSSFYSSPARAAEEPTGCGYATGSPGLYSETICWIDFSSYDESQARSKQGQSFAVSIGGGYTASFTVTARAVEGRPFHESGAFPTAAVPGSGFGRRYRSAPGSPVLWNRTDGAAGPSGVAYRLSDIVVTDLSGSQVDDYKFVSGDAEATFAGETIIFRSDENLEVLEELTPDGATGGCFVANTVGIGTTETRCEGVPSARGNTSSTLLFASESPTFIEQVINSDSRNAGVFGIMMTKVVLNKNVSSRVDVDDAFDIQVQAGSTVLADASTGSGNFATTGAVTVLAGSTVTLREKGQGATDLSDYEVEWACEVNGEPAPSLLPDVDHVTLQIPGSATSAGDLVECTITNNAKPRTLAISKTSDANEGSRVGDTITYTVKATNTSEVDYTEANPAVVFDDLSGVLDDAEYNADVSSSLPGDLSYQEPLLSWAGALAAGESVELMYSVRLAAGGDANVRNVSWVPNDPSINEPPTCEPPVDGVDPETGESCAVVEFPLPRLTIDKSADRTELPAIGEQVEYTITVTNVGPGVYTEDAPASFIDDLTDVLDATDFNNDASASVGEVSYDAPELSWSGALGAGESATISYTVTYTGEGDQNLRNLVCVPEPETALGTAPCDFVVIPGSDLTQWKQVQTSDDPAVAGSVLTYTLFFKNDGEAAATVDSIDDLTHVTDDADVTTEPTATGGLTATRDRNRIAVTGQIAPGETGSVTYQVTVKADGERGDDIAANFLMDNDPEDPPTPPEEPVCVPAYEQLPDCTSTPIAAVTYAKSVSASTPSVGAGTILTYTVTVESTGTATAPVSREDVLTNVLDDADLTSDPVSDTDSVTVTEVADGRFQIGGELAAGQTATVTYQVTVKDEADRGNNSADNFLIIPGANPPEDCEPAEGELPDCTSTLLPNVEASKSSDPESGSTVAEGQTVAYTLTFSNTGAGAGGVDYTDDLSGVFDDATLASGPEVSDGALTAALNSDGTIVVTGELAAGQTVTVTYTVTVNADGQRGDNRLGNVLAKTGTEDPDCGDMGVSCTTHPVPLLDSWKQVEANESPVAEGTVLTYTLFFENTGEAPAVVGEVDDLTHVTDDADVTTEPSSDVLNVTRDGNRIVITGEVPAGETYQVTYQVTVKPDGERGDDIAANFLMKNNPEDPPTPPEEPVCQSADTERPDCTINHVNDVTVAKSSDPDSGTEVKPGEDVTYTLTFTNTSANKDAAPVEIDYTDHMVDVLDDATLTGGPEVSNENLTAVTEGDRIRITGQVPTGETYTVIYTVTVNDYPEQGNSHLGNVVAITGGEPVCTDGSPLCTAHEVPPAPNEPGGNLSQTGGEISTVMITAAVALLLLGGLLLIASRRKASASQSSQDVVLDDLM